MLRKWRFDMACLSRAFRVIGGEGTACAATGGEMAYLRRHFVVIGGEGTA